MRIARWLRAEARLSETTTDWRGELRVGDLIRDSLLLAARRPLLVIVLPALVMLGTAWLATHLLGFGHGLDATRERAWVRPENVAAMPLLGFAWVAIAWEPSKQRADARERVRRALAGALLGTLLGLLFLIATEHTHVGGILLIGLFAPLVPVAACEPGWLGRSLRRSVALAHGSRWRILLAWGIMELALLLLGLAVLFVALIQTHGEIEYWPAYQVGLRVHAGLRWGLTMALCVAAYRRLKVSRAALDVDAWVEVFR